jgi:hypothetical protein
VQERNKNVPRVATLAFQAMDFLKRDDPELYKLYKPVFHQYVDQLQRKPCLQLGRLVSPPLRRRRLASINLNAIASAIAEQFAIPEAEEANPQARSTATPSSFALHNPGSATPSLCLICMDAPARYVIDN